ncbi:MAG: hypothetical protein VXY99_05810 [Pseudomonadota bacterium]|nr:hypothetical protein [Pseudomonadota bacterium]MEC8483315.1 hypothetical protein [Pseudomonadota bacterium]
MNQTQDDAEVKKLENVFEEKHSSISAHDSVKHIDNTRSTIAFLLIGLLFLVVIGIFLLVLICRISIEEMAAFGFMLSPIIALVSAATGFYYGQETSNKD